MSETLRFRRLVCSPGRRLDIHSIFPDELDRARVPNGGLGLEIKYFAGIGLKALARTGTAVEDSFFVAAKDLISV